MKYLKTFESIFGSDNAEPIDYDEYIKSYGYLSKPNDDTNFTESECQYLESLKDNNEIIEYFLFIKNGETFHSRNTRSGRILPTIIHIFLNPKIPNQELIRFSCHKTDDEWYYIEIHQETVYSQEQDGLLESGMHEFYKCDGFDCLKKLLNKYL